MSEDRPTFGTIPPPPARLEPNQLLQALRAELEHAASDPGSDHVYERSLCDAIQAVCSRYGLS